MAYKEQNYTAEKDAMLVSLVVMAFLFLVRTIRLTYRVCVGGLSLIQGKPVKRQNGIESSTHQFVSVDQVNLPVEKVRDFADKGVPKGVSSEAEKPGSVSSVAEKSSGESLRGVDERFQIASRIYTSRLKRQGECVGRLWLYSYEQAGFIRQVFKINDSKLVTALGTNRLDLGCVGFDPKAGEAGIETIKSEALEIVKQRFSAIA